jgi:RNA polymerase sigma factor (sigma-70 family)
MIDLVNIGDPRLEYSEENKVNLEESVGEYLKLARKYIKTIAPKIRADLASKILSSDDAISNIATVLMMADWRWNGKGTKSGYRAQRVHYALYAMLERDISRNKRGVMSLNHEIDDDGTQLCELLPDDTPSPDIYSMTQEERQQIEQVLTDTANITGMQSQCIQMHFLDEMTYADIGRKLGVSREAVRQSVHRGVNRIKEVINGNS